MKTLNPPSLKHSSKRCLALIISLKIVTGNAVAQDFPIHSSDDIFHPVIAKNGMVATQEDLATQAGLEVLKEGGNAVDAAVTIGFTLAVTLPHAGNLGGGGFMLVHVREDNETIAIDYREKAPLAATRDMFLDENGEVDNQKTRFSHLAVGVPGTVAGLILALEKYGTISLERALQPAIELAENGFPVDEDLRVSLRFAKKQMQASPASREIFYKQDGSLYEVGDILVQKDLAESLKQIAEKGKDAFYRGEIADRIVDEMEANNGLITKEDLAKYKPVIRQPIRGNYRGYQIYSMPPPSSGGVHLVEMLNILERFPLRSLGHNTAQTIHLMTETMKLAYADRFKYMGDTDFVEVPIKRLISKDYADELREKINRDRATPSREILPGNGDFIEESTETTHYSVVDKDGNAVSNTYTLNFSFGTGITVPGTGILLNNQMDDFTAKPGVANAFRLIGGEANAIAPEKRMLSSMTPTIVMKDGKPFLVTGSPGGSRIITTVLQIIINAIDHRMNIAEATNAVRVHHQWFPDELQVERDLNGDTIRLLTDKGHNVVLGRAAGSTQSIMSVNGILYGASDPRKPGALTLGY
ncbi:gamma-glutamyltransferase [Hydrococcus rivularis NIES-593]|uniref:Glutathione hydrolase proenzyme n=1 Tax=Hydrococcus rivularis NIES-593 TaxID=1921803 RepID=A0A1U7HD40_9CYAN|nr:gamma-glutamyltransferase [Hydrococcus rivularis]OKH21461.1 gamma-glutamyltransferase [Hydrococcus rivularis NIES-593]